MKTMIAKTLLQARNAARARGMVSKWIDENAPAEVARFLIDAYSAAKESDKPHVGCLLTMAFDSVAGSSVATECANLFGVKLRRARSIAESVCLDAPHEEYTIIWRKRISEDYCGYQMIDLQDIARYPVDLQNCISGNMIKFGRRDHVYAFRQFDGSVRLLIMDGFSASILADEEPFNGEPPLYFSERQHFVSPVFKLNLARTLIEYCLCRVGYPHIAISKCVYFYSQSAEIINREDIADAWTGVEVLLRSRDNIDIVFANQTKFLLDDDETFARENEMSRMLMSAIHAAGALYDEIWRVNRPFSTSKTVLDRLSKNLGIFSKA